MWTPKALHVITGSGLIITYKTPGPFPHFFTEILNTNRRDCVPDVHHPEFLKAQIKLFTEHCYVGTQKMTEGFSAFPTIGL